MVKIKNMKLQISPIKKMEDAMVIWPEETPDVDLVLDPRQGIGFKKNSIQVIYAFGILGITPQENIPKMLENFVKILKDKGELYIIEQDMDYILRSILGGDLSLSDFNKSYRKITYLNQGEIEIGRAHV